MLITLSRKAFLGNWHLRKHLRNEESVRQRGEGRELQAEGGFWAKTWGSKDQDILKDLKRPVCLKYRAHRGITGWGETGQGNQDRGTQGFVVNDFTFIVNNLAPKIGSKQNLICKKMPLCGECLTRVRLEAGDVLNQTGNVKVWSDSRLILEIGSIRLSNMLEMGRDKRDVRENLKVYGTGRWKGVAYQSVKDGRKSRL